MVEPNYVNYRRTYFEDVNSERTAGSWAFSQPSPRDVFLDVVLLPYHFATGRACMDECSAGYCLPGDPVPYLIYPPEINLSGLAAEAATVTGLHFAFQ